MPQGKKFVQILVSLSISSLLLAHVGDSSAFGAASFPRIPNVKEPAAERADIEQSYRFVGEHPEVARYVPCFCACSRTKNHKSIDDCFVQRRHTDGVVAKWNSHAAECSICVTVALQARDLYLASYDTPAIRAAVEKDLAPKFRYHTDTPPPPEANTR